MSLPERNLLLLNDKFSSLSTVYSSEESEKYFKLPLAVSSYNQSHLTSILSIPMIEGDGTFDEKEERYEGGFVVLNNFQFTVQLTFAQYENCISDYRHSETFCFIRPCLVRLTCFYFYSSSIIQFNLNNRNGLNSELKCIQVTKRDFLVSKTDFKVNTYIYIFGKLDVMFTNVLPLYFSLYIIVSMFLFADTKLVQWSS